MVCADILSNARPEKAWKRLSHARLFRTRANRRPSPRVSGGPGGEITIFGVGTARPFCAKGRTGAHLWPALLPVQSPLEVRGYRATHRGGGLVLVEVFPSVSDWCPIRMEMPEVVFLLGELGAGLLVPCSTRLSSPATRVRISSGTLT